MVLDALASLRTLDARAAVIAWRTKSQASNPTRRSAERKVRYEAANG